VPRQCQGHQPCFFIRQHAKRIYETSATVVKNDGALGVIAHDDLRVTDGERAGSDRLGICQIDAADTLELEVVDVESRDSLVRHKNRIIDDLKAQGM
jgi:hypothetical protein